MTGLPMIQHYELRCGFASMAVIDTADFEEMI